MQCKTSVGERSSKTSVEPIITSYKIILISHRSFDFEQKCRGTVFKSVGELSSKVSGNCLNSRLEWVSGINIFLFLYENMLLGTH